MNIKSYRRANHQYWGVMTKPYGFWQAGAYFQFRRVYHIPARPSYQGSEMTVPHVFLYSINPSCDSSQHAGLQRASKGSKQCQPMSAH